MDVARHTLVSGLGLRVSMKYSRSTAKKRTARTKAAGDKNYIYTYPMRTSFASGCTLHRIINLFIWHFSDVDGARSACKCVLSNMQRAPYEHCQRRCITIRHWIMVFGHRAHGAPAIDTCTCVRSRQSVSVCFCFIVPKPTDKCNELEKRG